jgi:6-phosphogluconolactonase/glucosamine-6-phosphate isomerase/deaminase
MSEPTQITVRRFDSLARLNAALVQRLLEALTTAAGGGAAIMLSGGRTPMQAYRELAASLRHPAANLSLLFSDDRYVPSTSEASNFHQSAPLLNALALPEESVLRVRTELPLEEAAADYERRIDKLLLANVRFRLGLLGLGADGHTASLFTAQDIERARGHRAIAVDRPDGMQAVSVSPEVLAHFSELIFVVAGKDKHDAVQSLINRSPSLTAFHAIQSRATTDLWLADT